MSTRPGTRPAAAGAGMSPRLRALLALLCFAALGLWAWHGALDAPFVFDDEPAIRDNPRIRELWPSGDANYAVQSSERGRPFVRLSLAVNYRLGELELDPHGPFAGVARALGIGQGGLDVRGYHLFNLGVHVLSALALFALVRRTLQNSELTSGAYAAAAPALAFVAAALWLVHPLQIDAVTYTIQRTELLMGLCLLATLYAAVRALDAPSPRRWEVASVGACALGMLSKEAMAVAPLLVALHDRVFVFPSWRAAWERRRGLYAGLAGTLVLVAWIVASGPRDETVGFGLGVPWWRYLETQGGMILHYLRLVFWPEPLCLDYGRLLAQGPREILPGALVVSALCAATLWALRVRPGLGFLGAWFFLLLAPSSSFLPIITEVGAERRMHLPLAAVVVLVVLGLHRLGQRLVPGSARGARAFGVLFGAALVIPLGVLTIRRNEVYRSELALWEDTVAKKPTNPGARNNLGRALARLGRFDEAVQQFSSALALPDCPPDALVNLGNVLTDLGRLDQAAAHFRQVLERLPGSPKAHEGLAAVSMRQERWADAVASYRTCLAAGHRSADIHSNLGKALYKLGRVDEAIREMRAALALDPRHETAARNLALVEAAVRSGKPGK